MCKLLFFSSFLFCALVNAQVENLLPNDKDSLGLTSFEYELVKTKSSEMLNSTTYKKAIQMSKEMSFKVNFNRIPMSNDTELKNWLTNNLKLTNFISIDETLETIRPYIKLYEQLLVENKMFYELIAKSSFQQFKEIMRPQLNDLISFN